MAPLPVATVVQVKTPPVGEAAPGVGMAQKVAQMVQQVVQQIEQSKKEEVAATFKAISSSSNLSFFRESLRLFFHHFLLRPGVKLAPKVDREVLSERVVLAETALMSGSSKLKL